MSGILRPLQMSDLPFLPGLLSTLVYEPVLWDADFLKQKIFDDPDYDPALCPVIEVKKQPVAMVHGLTRNKEIVFLKVVAVEPAHRRQGFATRLLDAFEAQARRMGAGRIHVGFSTLAYLISMDVRYTAAINLLLRRGYETERHSTVNMAVDLEPKRLDTQADEKRLASLGITVRRAVLADREGTADLAERIQGWQGSVHEAYNCDPIRLYVAERNGQIVSFAAQDVVAPTLFGPTGTDPAHRRLGSGCTQLCATAVWNNSNDCILPFPDSTKWGEVQSH